MKASKLRRRRRLRNASGVIDIARDGESVQLLYRRDCKPVARGLPDRGISMITAGA